MSVLRDAHHALRRLRREPGTTVAVVAVLGLGLGITTTVWSLVDAVLLRPLPFADAEHVHVLLERDEATGTPDAVAPPTFRHWRRELAEVAELAAFRFESRRLDDADQPTQLRGAAVSTGYLGVLGARLLVGRGFRTDEHQAAARRVLLDEITWRRHFAADPTIAGRVIHLDGAAFTVTGVVPRNQRYPGYADYYVPFDAAGDDHEARQLVVIGRRHTGVDAAQMRAATATVATRLATGRPELYQGRGIENRTLRRQLTGSDVPTRLVLLLGAVGVLLAVTVLDVAMLMTARVQARKSELAIRRALGADGYRLTRPLVAEALWLTFGGGALGLVLAVWLIDLAAASDLFAAWQRPALDPRVLATACAITTTIGLLCGLLPTHGARSWSLVSSRTTTRGQTRLSNALVVTQIALALTLVLVAGLLGRTLLHLGSVEIGFDADRVLSTELVLPADRYPEAIDRIAFTGSVLERLSHGERPAAVASFPPLSGSIRMTMSWEGRGERGPAGIRVIGGDYLRALGVPLLAGRRFDQRDTAGSAPVALVNRSFVTRILGDVDPLGERITFRDPRAEVTVEIVGVVGDVRYDGPALPAEPEIYQPYDQNPWDAVSFLVRVEDGDPARARPVIEQAVWSVDPTLPLGDPTLLATRLGDYLERPQLTATIVALFAGGTLGLAALGIYGLISQVTTRRRREIGIRMALGAARQRVLRELLGTGSRLLVLGLATGLIGSVFAVFGLRHLLVGVAPADPPSWLIATMVLTAVVLVATWLPARLAASVDPATVLRDE